LLRVMCLFLGKLLFDFLEIVLKIKYKLVD